MKNEAMQAAGEIASAKSAAAVAAGTVTLSMVSYLQIIQSWLSVLSLAAGLALSVLLFVKHWREMRKNDKSS